MRAPRVNECGWLQLHWAAVGPDWTAVGPQEHLRGGTVGNRGAAPDFQLLGFKQS
jgi:hypothetical protein